MIHHDEYDDWIRKVEKHILPHERALLPQRGFQFEYLRTTADIAIGGGSAGGGKTYALLLEPTRHRHIPEFAAMVFRRIGPEITNPGGLWDEAEKLYGSTTGGFAVGKRTFFFPRVDNPKKRGARVVFRHLQHENTVEQHKGGQYPLIMFDELNTFTEKQFWYMLSRNRTDIGIRPYCRAVTNPDSSGWLKSFIQWWIYPDDHPDERKAGFPIPERAGKVRYMLRDSGNIVWGDSVEEIVRRYPQYFPKDDVIKPKDKVKSVTFIPGNVRENLALMKVDPGYIGNLMALDETERNQLLLGNWKFTPGSNDLFDYFALEDMFTNDFISPSDERLKRYITADIALEGSDKFVVMVWKGWVITHVEVFQKTDSTKVLSVIRRIAQQHGVPARNICYDRDGVGDFVSGFIRQAYGFRGNASPLPMKNVAKKDPISGKTLNAVPNYANLRSQCYYELAAVVKAANLYAPIAPKLQTLLIQELAAVQKAARTAGGKLAIIPKETIKEKIGRSPDFGDCVMMRMVFEFRRVTGYIGSSAAG